MLKKYYLGGFFWVPILVKQHQNMSGFAGTDMFPQVQMILTIKILIE